jgi:hypothetical protein
MAPSPTPLHCHPNAVELEEEVGALHVCEGAATVRFRLINQNEGHFEVFTISGSIWANNPE